MKITRFEDLECWQEARKLVNMVYEAIAGSHEFERDMRLRDQCKGAAISTMGAIPEGFARRSNKEFIQYLFISLSSAAELQSHFYVALDRKYVAKEVFDAIYQQADKVGKMDSNLITYLKECDRRYNETQKTRKTNQINQTDQINQTNQINQTDQINQTNQIDQINHIDQRN